MARGRPRCVSYGGSLSYTGIAARRMLGESADVEARESFEACLEDVHGHRADIAVLPARNKIVGDICGADGVALAEKARSMCLRVRYTIEIPVEHVLASFGKLEEVTAVYSKSEALGQCSAFLERHGMRGFSTAPGLAATLSTATAAKYVADGRVHYFGAICNAEAAEFYGLPIVGRNIANSPNNSTLFHAYERDE